MSDPSGLIGWRTGRVVPQTGSGISMSHAGSSGGDRVSGEALEDPGGAEVAKDLARWDHPGPEPPGQPHGEQRLGGRRVMGVEHERPPHMDRRAGEELLGPRVVVSCETAGA